MTQSDIADAARSLLFALAFIALWQLLVAPLIARGRERQFRIKEGARHTDRRAIAASWNLQETPSSNASMARLDQLSRLLRPFHIEAISCQNRSSLRCQMCLVLGIGARHTWPQPDPLS